MTAPVERRSLVSTAIVRGSVVTVDPVEVLAPPRADGQTASVVTGAPLRTGAEMVPGRVLVEINGRPIIGLALAVPLYRDITPGTTGPDVTALQTELDALGFKVPADEQGVFGTASQAAVGQLFDAIGAEPAYVAGSEAAFRAGLAKADQVIDDALTAANRSRAAGTADPDLDAAVTTAEADRATYLGSQGIELRVAEVASVSSNRSVVVGPAPNVGDTVTAGRAVLTAAAPLPEPRLELTEAQVAQVTPKTRVGLTGPSYAGDCTPGRLIASSTDASDQPGSTETSSGTTDEGQPADSGDGLAEGDAGGSEPTIAIALSCLPVPQMEDVGAGYTATLSTTVAGAGLVVPATAVATSAGGGTFVERATADGHLRRVAVEVKAEDAGFVAIVATGGALHEGDRVRVRGD